MWGGQAVAPPPHHPVASSNPPFLPERTLPMDSECNSRPCHAVSIRGAGSWVGLLLWNERRKRKRRNKHLHNKTRWKRRGSSRQKSFVFRPQNPPLEAAMPFRLDAFSASAVTKKKKRKKKKEEEDRNSLSAGQDAWGFSLFFSLSEDTPRPRPRTRQCSYIFISHVITCCCCCCCVCAHWARGEAKRSKGRVVVVVHLNKNEIKKGRKKRGEKGKNLLILLCWQHIALRGGFAMEMCKHQ